MSYEVLVRFAPAFDARHFDEDAPDPRPELLVGHDALKTIKREVPAPVVIDHDFERVVGHVRNVWVAEDVDYGTRVRRWHSHPANSTKSPPG